MPVYRDPGDEDGYAPGAGAAYDGPGDAAAYGGPDAADHAGAEETPDEVYAYREPADTPYREPADPGPSDPPPPRTGDNAEDPAAYFSGPDEPAAYAREPAAVASSPPGDAGTSDPGPSPACDDGAEPAPYVAPDDPNTGADTEPFRGPFEPHPGQPKLSDYQPTGPLPAVLASSGEAPASLTDAGPPPDARIVDGRVVGGYIPDARLPDDGPGIDGPVRPGAVSLDAQGEPDRDGSQEKLEKIKDLYLTVEAIGDNNVDKHFDELLQRQRELISDYFKETGIGTGTARVSQPDQADQPVITDHDPRSN